MLQSALGAQLTPESSELRKRGGAAALGVLEREPGTRIAAECGALRRGEDRQGASRQKAIASGPREKRRPHRALKYCTGLVGRTEWFGWACGVVPTPEDYRAPGGAPQSRREGGSDRLKHQWTDTDYGEGSH
ncbi:hypothetical protein NDU88_005608 [Pleurodeles waltl]|uniref:Uncharacterized protein n=1 Tax=Pleurodeles waltl TaxID=8319 RepID=A0AAV7TUR3_PLEWA|nr:hypothetical protein NDU88_005608 [Pleurodeles waltl]